MRLLFWRKKKRAVSEERKSTEPILDGIKEVQLWVCPSCSKKAEILERCPICNDWMCEYCRAEATLWFKNERRVLRYDTLIDKTVCKGCQNYLAPRLSAVWSGLKNARREHNSSEEKAEEVRR